MNRNNGGPSDDELHASFNALLHGGNFGKDEPADDDTVRREISRILGRADSLPAAVQESAPAAIVENVQPEPGLAAEAFLQSTRRRSRAQLRGRFMKVLRRRISLRAAVDALLAEDRYIGSERDPKLATHGETLVRAAGKIQADAQLARLQRRLDRVARRIDRLRARQAMLLIRAANLQRDLVHHPDGGQGMLTEVLRDQASQRAQIASEIAQGSHKHQRLPRWIRRIPKLVFLADFLLLLYFFSGVTDVNWASPLSLPLAFAVLLAAMVTGISFAFLGFTGDRLRSHKDHSGKILFSSLDGTTKAACWFAAADIMASQAIMFIRMWTEVIYALGPGAGAIAVVIALVLAIVSALANLLVIAIYALDGSDQVARLDALSAAISGPLSRANEMREKADLIPQRITARQRRAHRDAAEAVTRAGRHLAAADQVIDAARAVHQAAGPYSEPASDPNTLDQVAGYRDDQSVPRPDLRAVRMTLEHIDEPMANAEQESSSRGTNPGSVEEDTQLRWGAGCG